MLNTLLIFWPLMMPVVFGYWCKKYSSYMAYQEGPVNDILTFLCKCILIAIFWPLATLFFMGYSIKSRKVEANG